MAFTAYVLSVRIHAPCGHLAWWRFPSGAAARSSFGVIRNSRMQGAPSSPLPTQKQKLGPLNRLVWDGYLVSAELLRATQKNSQPSTAWLGRRTVLKAEVCSNLCTLTHTYKYIYIYICMYTCAEIYVVFSVVPHSLFCIPQISSGLTIQWGQPCVFFRTLAALRC